ncbi:MAG: methylated-DNA--[protein]-cysteine S-methyltransferase [Planctomycetota bacterium]|jgi:O-6-methylguanine DNA methyltransferase
MEQYRYTIFRTQWGWFGLLGGEQGLVRTCLPVAHKEAVQSRLLSDIPNAERSKKAFSVLKNAIEDYYKGSPADFGNVEVYLGDTSDFQRKVLTTLQTISYGEMISYSQLAKLAGSPKAARAIGMVMAQNPLPLIIPCHRVIKADGSVGQFSAAGGTDTKKRMLDLERPL